MEEVPTGWQPDPFGLHEKRFISSDGLPTKLVSDGDIRSYDDPTRVAPLRSVAVPAPHTEPIPRQPGPTSMTQLPLQVPTRPPFTPGADPRNGRNGQNGHGPQRPPAPSPRLALLCGNCGQRHNAPDGRCPQCGEGPRVPGLQPVAPAPPPAQQDPVYPPPIVGPPSGRPSVDHPPPSPAMEARPPFVSSHSVNVFAIASLVLSLVALPIAGSILAIVFGVVAKRQIKETSGGQGGSGMASWGIALGCLGLAGTIIVALLLALGGGRSNGLTPGTGTSVKAAFTAASQPLDAADANLTRALTSGGGDSVAQIAQAVTPYVTALTTFDYRIRQISWTPAEQLQSERLELQVQGIIRYASTISSVTTATSTGWVTHLRELGAPAQSADNGLRSMVGVAVVSDFP